MQGHDEWLRELLRKREHVLAVEAAEDPVLVLQENDVDVESAEHPSRAHVVASHGLPDRREEPASLRTRRLVHDRNEVDALDAVDAEQCRAHVGGKRADAARARRVRGNDSRAHAGYLLRTGTGSIRCGSLSPRSCIRFPNVPFVAARSRSRTRLRLFLMMSLPVRDSPKQQAAGSCGSRNTWTLPTP